MTTQSPEEAIWNTVTVVFYTVTCSIHYSNIYMCLISLSAITDLGITLIANVIYKYSVRSQALADYT